MIMNRSPLLRCTHIPLLTRGVTVHKHDSLLRNSVLTSRFGTAGQISKHKIAPF